MLLTRHTPHTILPYTMVLPACLLQKSSGVPVPYPIKLTSLPSPARRCTFLADHRLLCVIRTVCLLLSQAIRRAIMVPRGSWALKGSVTKSPLATRSAACARLPQGNVHH